MSQPEKYSGTFLDENLIKLKIERNDMNFFSGKQSQPLTRFDVSALILLFILFGFVMAGFILK